MVRKKIGTKQKLAHELNHLRFYLCTLSCCLHNHPLLSKATYTPSIQPYPSLPDTCSSLTKTINTLLRSSYMVLIHSLYVSKTSQYSLFHSIHQLPFYSSSATLSICDNPMEVLKSLISKTCIYLFSALLIPYASAPCNVASTNTP